MQVFEGAIGPMLAEAQSIGASRGAVYRDTWHLDHLVTTYTRAVLARIGDDRSPEALRLVLAAALVDTKASRIAAGALAHHDSYIDGVNYLAALGSFAGEYESGHPRPHPHQDSAPSSLSGETGLI